VDVDTVVSKMCTSIIMLVTLQRVRMSMVMDTYASLFGKYFNYNSEASSNHSGMSEDQNDFKASLIKAYWGQKENGKASTIQLQNQVKDHPNSRS
jgi:hypothetical protein